jgi:prevent-host-death family protein
VALAEVKDDLSKYLRLAVDEEIVITRHGRPAGILIGFGSDEDWFEYRLEHHPEFLRRIEEARTALRAGHGIPLRDLR